MPTERVREILSWYGADCGGPLSKQGETAVDVVAYAAHLAAEMGAHVIKVKLPSAHLEQADAKKVYEEKRGSIIGRNSFQRTEERAKTLLASIATELGV